MPKFINVARPARHRDRRSLFVDETVKVAGRRIYL